MHNSPQKLLDRAGLKPTPNRILVLKALLSTHTPMSLIDLETELQTLERSSILRVLTLLLDNELIHIMEDGRGVSKYEVCRCEHHNSVSDMHVHFYCERCRRVCCFEDIGIPGIEVPAGYTVKSVNYMLKGLCPECTAIVEQKQ